MDQMVKDRETVTVKDGQQWTACYSTVGRLLPDDLKAYVVMGINGNTVTMGEAMNYLPARQVVLIEHADKTAVVAEAVTTIAPYAAENPTPVYALTGSDTGVMEWLTEPRTVSVGEGYTLYKDEFVMVSSGTLPAGIAFLPAGGVSARALSIPGTDSQTTGIDGMTTSDSEGKEEWYTLDGKRLDGKPSQKGLYLRNGKKVVIK